MGAANSLAETLRWLENSGDFVELHDGEDFTLDLRYATTNNFVGQNMYGEFRRAFVHRLCAEKLISALARLRLEKPRFKFLIFDALRPRSIQRILFAFVKGTDNEKYLANPEIGSLHNFGFAVDLSLLDEARRELDMGAGFDDFRPIAQPQLEEQFQRQGLLSVAQIANRQLLRGSMEGAGFHQLPHEWWHFDALPKAEVRAHYTLIE